MMMKHNKVQCTTIGKPYRCGTCDMRFSILSEFNAHMSKRHKGDSLSANFVPIEDIIGNKLEQFVTDMHSDANLADPEKASMISSVLFEFVFDVG
jgi:hypothetical protein